MNADTMIFKTFKRTKKGEKIEESGNEKLTK